MSLSSILQHSRALRALLALRAWGGGFARINVVRFAHRAGRTVWLLGYTWFASLTGLTEQPGWPWKLSRTITIEKLGKIEFLTSVTSVDLRGHTWDNSKGLGWPWKLFSVIRFEKLSKIKFLTSATSFDLGGQIWGHPVPLNRGRWATLDLCCNPEKWLFPLVLACPNQVWPLLTSEVTKADLNMWRTIPTPWRGHMPKISAIGWKLWPWCADPQHYRHRGPTCNYILRFADLTRESLTNFCEH